MTTEQENILFLTKQVSELYKIVERLSKAEQDNVRLMTKIADLLEKHQQDIEALKNKPQVLL